MTIWFSVLSVDCCVVQYVCSRFSLRSALCTFRIISGGCVARVALIEERKLIEECRKRVRMYPKVIASYQV